MPSHTQSLVYEELMTQIIVYCDLGLHSEKPALVNVSSSAADHLQSGSINRVGTVPPPPLTPPPTERSCPTNYSRIGDNCYYVSMWHDYRAIWKVREQKHRCSGRIRQVVSRTQSHINNFLFITFIYTVLRETVLDK